MLPAIVAFVFLLPFLVVEHFTATASAVWQDLAAVSYFAVVCLIFWRVVRWDEKRRSRHGST